jgi:hypothetical protein
MHTNPEVLALVALGERGAATPADLDHIAHCESCGREVTELGHLTQVGRSISDHFTLETPSPEVWDRIRTQLGFGADFSSNLVPPPSATAAPVSTYGATTAPPRRHRRTALALVVADVLALLAGVGGTLAWQGLRPLTDTVIASTALEASPGWRGATGNATLEEDPTGRKILVVSMVTPRPVDGMQAVWLIDRDRSSMTQVGFLTAPVQRYPLPKAFDISRYPVVDISVEQPDGDLAHSGDSIVGGTLDL